MEESGGTSCLGRRRTEDAGESLGIAQIRCRGRGLGVALCSDPTLAGFHNVVALMHVDGNSPRSPQAPGVCPAPHPAPSSTGPAPWSDAERATDQDLALCPPGHSSPRPAPAPAARCPRPPPVPLPWPSALFHAPKNSSFAFGTDVPFRPRVRTLRPSRRAFLFRMRHHRTLHPRPARCPFPRDRRPGNGL